MKNKLLVFVLLFLLATQIAYTEDNTTAIENIEESSTNIFLEYVEGIWSYMQGKNRFGLNFAPNIHIYALPTIADSYSKTSGLDDGIAEMLKDEVMSSVDSTDFDLKIKSKAGSFGMTFYYDFVIYPFMSISLDAGFFYGSLSIDLDMLGFNADGSSSMAMTANVDGRYKIIPYSIGVKFYPMKSAPYGFYIMPQLGGAYVDISTDVVAIENSFQTVDLSYDISGHGVYLGFELGWNVELFKELTADLPIDVSLDIGILDFKYYIKPWLTGNDNALLNLAGSFLPRLGFSVVF